MWHFRTIGIITFTHEVFGSPQWLQEIYQGVTDYRIERGRSPALWL